MTNNLPPSFAPRRKNHGRPDSSPSDRIVGPGQPPKASPPEAEQPPVPLPSPGSLKAEQPPLAPPVSGAPEHPPSVPRVSIYSQREDLAEESSPPVFRPATTRPRPDGASEPPPVVAPPAGGPPVVAPTPLDQPVIAQTSVGPPVVAPPMAPPPVIPPPAVLPPSTAQPGQSPVIATSSAAQRVRPRHTQPAEPQSPPPPPPPPPAGPPRRRWRKALLTGFALVLAALLAWPIGLAWWANGRMTHVPALSGAANTAGITWLLAGTDQRDETFGEDQTAGSRTDTIMVLHKPPSGPVALISLPRDTYVDIAGHGPAKLNAAYVYGGPPLLVSTVESITGLTVDHYAEIGLSGLRNLVNGLGGISLCLDYDVDDPDSGLLWTAGCHVADGDTALAFARMRYSDPTGDIGRAERQRQVISAVTGEIASLAVLANPLRQITIIDAGLGALAFSEGTNIIDLARMALAFKAATGEGGITGTPPIADPNYRPGDVGSTVLLDPEQTPIFFQQIQDGSLPPGPVGGL